MKKVFNLIICTVAIGTLASCGLFEDEKSTNETVGVKKIVEFPDSIKKKIVEQDALMTELVNKVDTLTDELNSTKAENSELKKKIDELKSPKSTLFYISISAFSLGLIALVVALLKPKGIKEDKVILLIKNCIDSSRKIKELQVDVNSLLSSSQHNKRMPQATSSNTSNSEARLRLLESRIEQVIEFVDKIKPTQQVNSPHQETFNTHVDSEYQKVGYAKVDTDSYFTTIYESNQEGCVFKITFTSQSKGKFNIISLDKIQSRNDWQKKIECSGISIKEASDFRLEEEGICEKIDEINWKVTKPLKIRLH